MNDLINLLILPIIYNHINYTTIKIKVFTDFA